MKNKTRKDKYGIVLNPGESLQKDGKYIYQYTDFISQKRKKIYGKTLAELRTKEEKILRRQELYSGTDPSKQIKFEDYFYKVMEKKPKSPANKVKELDLYRRNAAPYIGEMDIRDIAPEDLDRIYFRAHERGLKRVSVDRIRCVLDSAFREAIFENIIKEHPGDHVQFFRIIYDPPNLNIEEKKNKSLSVEQQTNLIQYAENSKYYDDLAPILKFGFSTGMRFGEIGGLTLDNIDFINRIIYVKQQVQYLPGSDGEGYTIIVCPPKTECSIRALPLFESAKKSIDIMLERNIKPQEGYEKFIFLNKNGLPYYPSLINKRLDNMLKSYNKAHPGAELPHISTHAMRHTAVKNMKSAGIPFEDCSKYLGHSNLEITSKIYYDNSIDEINNSIEKMISQKHLI